jgi:hypothetical protein
LSLFSSASTSRGSDLSHSKKLSDIRP